MPYLAVIGTAFALAFLAELPDKSMFASLILGTRYRPSWVWAGAATAFAVHMARRSCERLGGPDANDGTPLDSR